MENNDVVQHKVRRAAGLVALRKISKIVEQELKDDAEKAQVVRWFVRYGWIILSGCALLLILKIQGVI